MAVARGSRLRWFGAQVRAGGEDAVAQDCLRRVGRPLLADCFAPRVVRMRKRDGVWVREQRLLYPGYLFMLTTDAQALDRELRRLALPVTLTGADDVSNTTGTHHYTPLKESEQALLESVLDERHVLQPSTGVIERGRLKVGRGPLRGHEGRIRKVDRHRRVAFVDAGVPGCDALMCATLEITAKS